jgi:ABC-type Na+ efflux pump permease subunit
LASWAITARAKEKEKRTIDFLLTSPAKLMEVIAGKALTGVVYSALIAAVLLALNRQMIGNWPLTMLTILFGLLLVVAIGLLMGSVFQTIMQVNTWASLALLVLIAPSFPFPVRRWCCNQRCVLFPPTILLSR